MTRSSFSCFFLRLFAALLFLAAPALAAEPDIKLLSKDEAAIAIVEEKIEPYFKLLTLPDMAAKLRAMPQGETLEARRADFKRQYAGFTLDFTDEEKAVIHTCLTKVRPALEKHYPLMAKTPWSIIKKSDVLEGGAHFTRESHIVLSARVPARAARLMKENQPDAAVAALLPLLLHEQMHVLQRLHPKVFADLYENIWGYRYAAKITTGAWLDARQMVNPDGVDVNWLLPTKDDAGQVKLLWPRILLTKTEGVPVMFRDMQMVLIEVQMKSGNYMVKLKEDGSPVMSPLMESKPFAVRFPHGNAYHPNETAAAALPAVILADLFPEFEEKKPGEQLEYEAKLRQWMRDHLK